MTPEMIHFTCPSCDQSFDAPPDMAGQVIDCTSCKNKIHVPVLGRLQEVASRKPVPRLAIQKVRPKIEPFLLTLADIGITSDMVVTPNGSGPLAGSQWICTDMTRTETKIPGVAICLAIIFSVLCLIGLLFLLMKESVMTGYVEISVRAGSVYHRAQVPVSSPAQVQQVRSLVASAQQMAARATIGT